MQIIDQTLDCHDQTTHSPVAHHILLIASNQQDGDQSLPLDTHKSVDNAQAIPAVHSAPYHRVIARYLSLSSHKIRASAQQTDPQIPPRASHPSHALPPQSLWL